MVSFCVLDQHDAVRRDHLPFPSPNEVKIKFVLANKEKLLISLNLCQSILCYTDQRNTHSLQTCSTSKKEWFCWHRATFYFLALLPSFFLLSTEIRAKLFYCLLTHCLYSCLSATGTNVFLYILSRLELLITNANIALSIIFNAFLHFTKSVKCIRVMFTNLVSQNKT